MAKKDRKGVMYSTNPDFEYDDSTEEQETLENNEQKLYVSLDRRNRKGKSVSLIEGFVGSNEDLKDLAKQLKNLCGVGGTAKNEEIIIQGDFRDKIVTYLKDKSYIVKKKG
jgi:translation initiation factor 1